MFDPYSLTLTSSFWRSTSCYVLVHYHIYLKAVHCDHVWLLCEGFELEYVLAHGAKYKRPKITDVKFAEVPVHILAYGDLDNSDVTTNGTTLRTSLKNIKKISKKSLERSESVPGLKNRWHTTCKRYFDQWTFGLSVFRSTSGLPHLTPHSFME